MKKAPRYIVNNAYSPYFVAAYDANNEDGHIIHVVNRTENEEGWKKAYWFAVKIAEDLNAAEPGNPP